MIQFTRRCFKVRECDRRSLAMSLDAIVMDDYVKALRVADRERNRRRLADVRQDQRRHVLHGRTTLRFGQ
jgi:hypothetical protein